MTEPNRQPISSDLMNKSRAFTALPVGTQLHPADDGDNWQVKFPDGYVAVDWEDFVRQLFKRIAESN